MPWLIGEDFNEILSHKEKSGGLPRPQRQMDELREAIDYCGLQDLGFSGHPYTWSNNRREDQNVQCRLDHFPANLSWLELWREARVTLFTSSYLDHAPILLETKKVIEIAEERRKEKLLRFEKMWEQEEECLEIIRRGWNHLGPNQSLQYVADSTLLISQELRIWNKNRFGNVNHKIKVASKEIQHPSKLFPTKSNLIALKTAKRNLNELLQR